MTARESKHINQLHRYSFSKRNISFPVNVSDVIFWIRKLAKVVLSIHTFKFL